jgi:hypothetical protein
MPFQEQIRAIDDLQLFDLGRACPRRNVQSLHLVATFDVNTLHQSYIRHDHVTFGYMHCHKFESKYWHPQPQESTDASVSLEQANNLR